MPKGRTICKMEVDNRKWYQTHEKHTTDEAKSKHQDSIKHLWHLKSSLKHLLHTQKPCVSDVFRKVKEKGVY